MISQLYISRSRDKYSEKLQVLFIVISELHQRVVIKDTLIDKQRAFVKEVKFVFCLLSFWQGHGCVKLVSCFALDLFEEWT